MSLGYGSGKAGIHCSSEHASVLNGSLSISEAVKPTSTNGAEVTFRSSLAKKEDFIPWLVVNHMSFYINDTTFFIPDLFNHRNLSTVGFRFIVTCTEVL